MFQIVGASAVVACLYAAGGAIWACQVPPEMVSQFTEYTIYAVTRRYLLISGHYTGGIFQASFPDHKAIAYPVELIPLK